MASDANRHRVDMQGMLDAAQTSEIESGYMLCRIVNFWGAEIVRSIDLLTEAYRKVNQPVRYVDPHPDR